MVRRAAARRGVPAAGVISARAGSVARRAGRRCGDASSDNDIDDHNTDDDNEALDTVDVGECDDDGRVATAPLAQDDEQTVFEWHVLYSVSFQVPALYFSVARLGRQRARRGAARRGAVGVDASARARARVQTARR